MELRPETVPAYLELAFTRMLSVADRLGEPQVNHRPLGEDTNAVGALIVHCCGVAEYWLGHLALGEPSERDRDSEFTTTASVAELHALVDDTLERSLRYVARLEAGEGTPDVDGGGRRSHPTRDGSDAGLVLHVLEELFQHLGHMEIAADALLA